MVYPGGEGTHGAGNRHKAKDTLDALRAPFLDPRKIANGGNLELGHPSRL